MKAILKARNLRLRSAIPKMNVSINTMSNNCCNFSTVIATCRGEFKFRKDEEEDDYVKQPGQTESASSLEQYNFMQYDP